MESATQSVPAFERYQEKLFTGSSHSWAIEQLLMLPRESRILDIGSGSGTMGRIAKENNFAYCAGVEIDSTTLEKTKHLYSRIESNLSLYNSDSNDQLFDILLLLDILEHIPDYEVFLNKAASLLKPGGKIIISLPNIAHWSVRIPLLFGFFEYTSRGILDRTHLHFFNRRRALSMIEKNEKLKLINYSVSIPPLEFVLAKPIWNNAIFRFFSLLHNKVAQLLPGFLGYQHLMVVEKITNR